MAPIREALAQSHVFNGMSPEHLDSVAVGAVEHSVAAGHLLLTEGTVADRCFVICDGSAAMELSSPEHPPVRFLTLYAGEVIGWSWLFPPYTWAADVRATTDCRLISIDAARLRTELEGDPHLGFALALRFGTDALLRAKESWYQIVDLTVRDA